MGVGGGQVGLVWVAQRCGFVSGLGFFWEFCLGFFVGLFLWKKCVRVSEGERTVETARIPCCIGCLGWCMLCLVWCVSMLPVYSGLWGNLGNGAWISSLEEARMTRLLWNKLCMNMKVILPKHIIRADFSFGILSFECTKNVTGACCILWEANLD